MQKNSGLAKRLENIVANAEKLEEALYSASVESGQNDTYGDIYDTLDAAIYHIKQVIEYADDALWTYIKQNDKA